MNAVPSREIGRLLGEGELPGAWLGGFAGALPILLHQLRRRRDVQLAGAPVDDDGGALGQVQHVAAGRHDHRDVAGPGQDRGVRGGAPLRQHHTGHEVQVEGRRLGGGQVVGDQDPGGRHPPRGLAGQGPEHLLAHRAYVGRALAQVGVGKARPLGLDLGQAARPGGDGSDAARRAGP